MGRYGGGIFQLGQDFLGQLLSQLHAPLIEAEDIPDEALDSIRGLDERAEPLRQIAEYIVSRLR